MKLHFFFFYEGAWINRAEAWLMEHTFEENESHTHTHTLMNRWFPEGLESLILPGNSDKTFVWWHRNKSLCWTTVGVMAGWGMTSTQTHGTFPVGPGGGVKPEWNGNNK